MKTNNYLCALAMACSIAILSGCSSYDETQPEDSSRMSPEDLQKEVVYNADDMIFLNGIPTKHPNGFIYTQGNEPGQNYIYIYQQVDGGGLTFKGKVTTGDSGNGISLASQGAVVIDRKNRLLFAVNAGSNTITSFAVRENGALSKINTVPSEGITPVSLAVHGSKMYAVHSGSSSISGFKIQPDGVITYIPNSSRRLSAEGAGPAQISISPNGSYIFVTEKITNKISKFRIGADGIPGERVTIASNADTPSGFDFAHNRFMVVTNAGMNMNMASGISLYSGIDSGALSGMGNMVPNHQTSSSSLKTTENGYFAFATNTGNDNISSYYLRTDGSAALVNATMSTGDSPTELTIASDNISVYVMCEKDHTIHSYLRMKGGQLKHTGKFNNMARTASGLASW